MNLLDRMALRAAHRSPKPLLPLLSAGAAAVAAAALANHLVARRTERRNPPTGRFLTVDGVRLHLTDQGEGPPVVWLHGNGGMTEEARVSGVPDRLLPRRRVVILDRPGFGHSERPRSTIWTAAAQARLMRGALRQIGVERPVIVGHSWGTLVALEMALQAPEDTGALVLMSGYYVPTPRLDVALLSLPGIPVVGDLLNYTVQPLMAWLLRRRVFRKIFAPAPVTPRFEGGFPTAMAVRPSQIRASGGDTALMIPAAAATLGRRKELTMPVFLLAGDGDAIVDTQTQSVRLHQELPDGRLRVVPGAGHMVHHTAADAALDVIEAAVAAAHPGPGRIPGPS